METDGRSEKEDFIEITRSRDFRNVSSQTTKTAELEKLREESKELEEKIKRLEAEIKHGEQLLLSDVIKSLLPKKCEYCGCYDGIHRTDCSFMRKYW